MSWRHAFGWLVACAGLGYSGQASADVVREPSAQTGPVAVHLSYAAPPDCPNEKALRERVSALTPRVVWSEPGAASRELGIRLAIDTRGARGMLTMRGTAHESLVRQLQAATCSELSEAMAIIVALILDPDAKLETPPETTRKPEQPARTSERPAAALRPRKQLSAHVDPEIFVVGGPTPSPSVGAAVGVSVLFLEKSPLELGVRASLRASLAEDLATQYGPARFAWRAMSLELCPLGSPSHRVLRAEACLAFDAGQIVASAASNPGGEAERTWLAPGAALHASVNPLDLLGLEATGALSAPLIRDRFLLTPFAIHQPAALAWRAGLALSIKFF